MFQVNRTSKIAALLLIVISIAILIVGGLYYVHLVLPESGKVDYALTDEEYVGLANKTIEAQFFLRRHPDSTILVDRSGRLAVDYRVEMNDSYVRLRVLIDHERNEVSEMFLDINGTYIHENILDNLHVQMEFQTILKGYSSGHTESTFYVIQDEGEWVAVWSQHQSIFSPQLPPPEVNFSEGTIIGVFMGEFSTGGYGIEIMEVIDMNQFVVVKVEKTYPGEGCIVTMAFSQPYHIVRIDKIYKEVTFDTVERIIECP